MNQTIKWTPPEGGVSLPDNDQWEFRFEIKSESSNRIYVISRHKKHHYWGCSCPGWCTHKTCKHLRALGLPQHMREDPTNYIH